MGRLSVLSHVAQMTFKYSGCTERAKLILKKNPQVHIYIHVYMYVYVYTDKERERETTDHFFKKLMQ